MAPRAPTRPEKDSDYSNIGISGRRTGVSLAPGRLDVNGLEELSGIFSSPRKPSPLRKATSTAEEPESSEEHPQTTPQTRSTRKSKPLRSASPRKSGISGTARRSKGVDVLGQNRAKENQIIESEPLAKTPVLTPTPNTTTRRFSPAKSPLPAQSTGRRISRRTTNHENEDEDQIQDRAELEPQEGAFASRELSAEHSDYDLPLVEDDVEETGENGSHNASDDGQPSLVAHDDEPHNKTSKSSRKPETEPKMATIANSRKKRKSDAAESEIEQDIVSSPAAKRAKRISEEASRNDPPKKISSYNASIHNVAAEPKANKSSDTQHSKRGNTKNSSKSKISARQQVEIDAVVDKIKARPGQKKSLYILRREDRNDSSTQTRSGRISVKPLAYWRNERCVYGGSPSGAVLQDGARFPLNSIKEIIRAEETDLNQKKKKKPRKKAAMSKSTRVRDGGSREPTESDSEPEEISQEDLDVEPWEVESGTRRGPVSLWDPEEQQAALGEEDEVDIAYASGAIEPKDYKESGFKYAILLSTKFFASGIVELPPGSIKRPKNSTKMQMSFFVSQGRVTATVGPINSPGTRFSIGKGGFWQVPRGNQYSIENEQTETATIFFSQGCESEPYQVE